MSVSRRLRFEILRRDSYTCRYCGAKAPDATLTVDHVIPVTLGGGDEPNNLVTACRDCNAGKSSIQPDSPLVEDVDAAAMLWAKAIEHVAERRREDMARLDGILSDFSAHWDGWSAPHAPDGVVPRPQDWTASVSTWVEQGLDLPDLTHLADIAMRSKAAWWDTWKYFCGCCWRELTKRQEMARALIEDGEV